MIKCPICGTENADNANFCNNCGNSLEKNKELYVYSDKKNRNLTIESPISPEMMIETINEDDSYSFKDWLNSIAIDRKWKIFLKKLHDVTIWLGEKLVPVGQYIVKIISKIANEFSGAITGAIVGGIIGLLFSMIPLIGWVLGPLVTSVFAFTGAIAGFIKDLINKLPVEGQEAIKNNIIRLCNAGYM